MQTLSLSCIHAFVTFDRCGRPLYSRRTHGWLCADHYRQQQYSIPPKPRRERGYIPVMTDDDIIRDIIQTDSEKIAAGVITVVSRGVWEPVQLRLLE